MSICAARAHRTRQHSAFDILDPVTQRWPRRAMTGPSAADGLLTPRRRPGPGGRARVTGPAGLRPLAQRAAYTSHGPVAAGQHSSHGIVWVVRLGIHFVCGLMAAHPDVRCRHAVGMGWWRPGLPESGRAARRAQTEVRRTPLAASRRATGRCVLLGVCSRRITHRFTRPRGVISSHRGLVFQSIPHLAALEIVRLVQLAAEYGSTIRGMEEGIVFNRPRLTNDAARTAKNSVRNRAVLIFPAWLVVVLLRAWNSQRACGRPCGAPHLLDNLAWSWRVAPWPARAAPTGVER